MMQDQIAAAASPADPWKRRYAVCGWILVFCAALFSIAPATGGGFIVMGLLAGAVLSFCAYGASRFGWRRLAMGFLLLGLALVLTMFVTAPSLHKNMMKTIQDRQTGK